MLGAVYLVERSRTGRAWKSLREDPLAAELMGMPVNRLKLDRVRVSAPAIAGLTGTLFAALNTAVFSADFDTPTLIIVYAMLILGGAGSLGGVILGALVVNVSLEVLRTPGHATWVFYTLHRRRRSSRSCAPGGGSPASLGGTIALGFAVHAIVDRGLAARDAWTVRRSAGSSAAGSSTGCVAADEPADDRATVAFIALVFAVLLVTTLLHGWMQKARAVPDALPRRRSSGRTGSSSSRASRA